MLPIVRQQMGEIDAKVVESARVRALALLGREEEAIELGKQMRAFFVQIGGEEWTQVKALDRIISKVKQASIAPKRNIRKTTVASSAAMNVTCLTIPIVAV